MTPIQNLASVLWMCQRSVAFYIAIAFVSLSLLSQEVNQIFWGHILYHPLKIELSHRIG